MTRGKPFSGGTTVGIKKRHLLFQEKKGVQFRKKGKK